MIFYSKPAHISLVFFKILLLFSYSLWASFSFAEAVNPQAQEIDIAIEQEPPSLNSMKATDNVSFMLLGHIGEGLLRYNKRNRLVAGVAKNWTIDSSGATFWLREDAKWSDGVPVKAEDFVFAWRQVLNPENGSKYASILYSIKNAEAVNTGKAPISSLGVTAVDDYTLKVDFEKPTPYFLSLTAFSTYFPVREDFYRSRGKSYAADADDLVFNGPFKLTQWIHGASLRLEKNDFYWNKRKIRLNVINIPYITADTTARFNLFKSNKIAYTELDSTTLQQAVDSSFRIRKFSQGTVFFVDFNFRNGRLTANKNLRKAMQSVLDTEEIVNKVLATPGNTAGYSLFPKFLYGVRGKFREEYPVKQPRVDIERAKAFIKQAKLDLRIDNIPPLTLLIGESPNARKQGEYLQNVFNSKLGLEVVLDIQEFKQLLAKLSQGDFDLALNGWGPDFNDPMTFATIRASWDENNRGRFANNDYDRWLRVAQDSINNVERMDAMGRLQDIIFDEVALLPLFERGVVYLKHKNLRGLTRRVVGADPDFSYSRVARISLPGR